MTHAKTIGRRDVLRGTGVAALAAVGAVVPLASATANVCREPGARGGELAALVRRYLAEIETFNATDHKTDRASDAHAAATYEGDYEPDGCDSRPQCRRCARPARLDGT
jgi:hypothetical protein